MRRFRYKPRTHSGGTFALNINSMTDMFTIMLVFLLQTYSTNPIEIKPVDNVRMPASASAVGPTEAVQIGLSKSALTFEGKELVKVTNDDFAGDSLDKNDPSFIKPLFEELNKLAIEAKTKEAKEGRLLIQADRELPYETIRKVMYTASMAGFPKVKLAVVAGN